MLGDNVEAVTLGRFIFLRGEANPIVINHESIHVLQYQEMGMWQFVATYVGEYIRNRLSGMSSSSSYRMISLEREAYDHEADLSYIDTRHPRAWEAYVVKK